MTSIPGTAMPTPTTPEKKDAPSQPSTQEPVIVPVQPYNVTPASILPATQLAAAINTPIAAPASFQVVNVEEIKKAQDPSLDMNTFTIENDVWYNKLIAWMGFGALFGVIVAFLGLIHYRLFFLAPVGPTVGTIAWYTRQFLQKHIKKFDTFAH